MNILKKAEHKKWVVRGTATAAVIITITGIWLGTRNNAYAISIDGQVVGIVKYKEEAQQAYEHVLAQITEEAGKPVVVNEILEIEPVHASRKTIETTAEMANTILDTVSYEVEAYEIVVDGTSYAVVATREDAASVLQEMVGSCLNGVNDVTLEVVEETSVNVTDSQAEQVAQSTDDVTEQTQSTQNEVQQDDTSKTEADGQAVEDETKQLVTSEAVADSEKEVLVCDVPDERVENVAIADLDLKLEEETATEEEAQKIDRNMQKYSFNEEIMIRSCYVAAEKILDEVAAKESLEAGRLEQLDYTLQEGDNIWDIAMAHDTTEARIIELNQETIEDTTKMQIGQVIKVEALRPILSITTVEEATFKELIPCEIEYRESKKLYEGETITLQEGGDGMKSLTVEVTKVNGEEVSRKLVSETTLSKAEKKIIAYGTKKKEEIKQEASSNSNSNSSSSSNSSSNSNSNSSSTGSSTSSSKKGFSHPLKGAGRISSTYGPRWGTFHYGQDYAAPAGTPIYAAKAGKVIYSSYNNGGYGKLVILDHGDGTQTYYAHCSSLYVNVGERVSKGEHIAAVGTTGDSTGNHLHFEIRVNGTPVNPAKYL